ncbi:hypothetical protein ACQV2S_01180 [Facklamia sp. P13064]|uniref:hypothetical protein n=1 Tax=Facklamia sp. P13064 TaxID=3421953 RepID=UPI003D1759D4
MEFENQVTVDETTEETKVTEPEKSEESKNSFSQEDVNNVVARETKKATENLLKELGIEDFENAKDGLQKFREWKNSQKTEAEKQSEKLQAAITDKEQIAEENSTLKAQISAYKLGVKDDSLEDVIQLAKAKVTDDITIDDAIKQVVEKYPHFKEAKEDDSNTKPKFVVGKNPTSSDDGDVWESVMKKYKK